MLCPVVSGPHRPLSSICAEGVPKLRSADYRSAHPSTVANGPILAVQTLDVDLQKDLDSLFTADEDALFHIANKFDLRHRNDKQHTDYNPAFRDWVFWWYLATIELTDRLIARQNAPDASPESWAFHGGAVTPEGT